jgi:hypothetical protein
LAIPTIRADFLSLASKIVEHSRYLPKGEGGDTSAEIGQT